ncbi:MAG: ATP-binding cassette domain-containing protein [Lawsonibacter sp.]|nr:ATP-binding cassette domain-containing protein [Lawsonibacter sp.]
MLSVERLTVYRGSRPVLEDVTFDLPPGQIAAVLGLNGAGKTTLLKTILGFLPKKGGVSCGEECRWLGCLQRSGRDGWPTFRRATTEAFAIP